MPKRDGGARAASVLASSIVIAFGLVACAFMAAVMGRGTETPMMILGGGGAALVLFQWLMFRSKDRDENFIERWYWARLLKKRQKPDIEYQVKVIKPKAVEESNGPPTVERIRELKENSHTWVPSGSKRAKRPPAGS